MLLFLCVWFVQVVESDRVRIEGVANGGCGNGGVEWDVADG